MSDPLKGLKPTIGPVEVASGGVRGKLTEYFVRRVGDDVAIAADVIDPETSAPSEANATLIADAFNVHHSTGLAPSQLAKALADEKALTAELISQCDEAVEALTELGTSCMVAQVHRDPRIHAQFVRAQEVAAKAKGKRDGSIRCNCSDDCSRRLYPVKGGG